MALLCSTASGGSCCARSVTSQAHQGHHRRSSPFSSPPLLVSLHCSREGSGSGGRSSTHVVGARRGLSSRTRRLEERGKKKGLTTKPLKEDLGGEEEGGGGGFSDADASYSAVEVGVGEGAMSTPMPDLPGLQPDFWEGPQWDAFGFIVQYLWAFGIVFGLIACGIAVATYNEGATDFKETRVYKESVQSRELLEEPESSGSDVFEGNPTEEAPAVE